MLSLRTSYEFTFISSMYFHDLAALSCNIITAAHAIYLRARLLTDHTYSLTDSTLRLRIDCITIALTPPLTLIGIKFLTFAFEIIHV